MKYSFKSLLLVSIILITSLYLSGCVNIEQKTKLNADGSGTMDIKYWTKSKNVSGDELSGFGFTEEKVKKNYTSSNSEPSNIKIVKNETTDSMIVVTLDLKFKDFNKLSEANAFKKIKASWTDGKEGKDFKYTLLSDTGNAKSMGMSDYKLIYEFEFPNEVLSTNGNKDGKTVRWEKTIADLKNDVDFTATVKGGKKCGLFGIELPLIFLAGIGFIYLKRRK